MSSWWVPCPPQVGGCWTQWTLYIQDQTDRSEGKGRHCCLGGRTLSIPSRTTDFAPWRIQRIGWIEDRTLGRDASEKWMFFQKLFFKSFLLLNGQSGIQVRPQKSTFALPTVCFFFYAGHHRVEGQRILHIVFCITKLIMVALVGQVTSARERYREHFVHLIRVLFPDTAKFCGSGSLQNGNGFCHYIFGSSICISICIVQLLLTLPRVFRYGKERGAAAVHPPLQHLLHRRVLRPHHTQDIRHRNQLALQGNPLEI